MMAAVQVVGDRKGLPIIHLHSLTAQRQIKIGS